MFNTHMLPTLSLALVLTLLAACGQAAPAPSVGSVSTIRHDIADTARVVASTDVLPTRAQPTSSTSSILPVELPAAVALPRSVTYAGLEWTVEQAVIDNRRITLFGPSDERTDAYRAARIDLHVNNPLNGYTKLDSRVVTLHLADGTRYDTDETGRVDLPGGHAETDSQLIFRVPSDATWQDATLVISEAERVPAEIPLDGAMQASPFPHTLTAQGHATVEGVTYTLLESSFDLDLHAVRSNDGEQFLELTVRVENSSTGGGGLALTDDAFRLKVAAATLAPADDIAELVKPSSSATVTVVFAVPDDVSTATLLVGDGEATAPIPLDLATH